MAKLSDVIKVTQEQYDTLLSGGQIPEVPASGETPYTYDENAIYLVEKEEPSWVSQNLSSQNYLNLGDWNIVQGKTIQFSFDTNNTSNIYCGQMTIYPTWKSFYYAYIDSDPYRLIRLSFSGEEAHVQVLNYNSGTWTVNTAGTLYARIVD